ncbi:hypothetical protein CROQUDRAFT_394792 [Cronartium quercuum f. sp. fusiforme G11]|uniref:Uncharacterized protein n=1 Tax=Cronartium quercuum f. sp. fusiforme G11 TaxID=708437 RepID=A0A9P6T5S0_9BASI|nr:hypothetical protein CROQUDRAFT_394792 [Cronartium quercuum f. sp. fusiforme G11]
MLFDLSRYIHGSDVLTCQKSLLSSYSLRRPRGGSGGDLGVRRLDLTLHVNLFHSLYLLVFFFSKYTCVSGVESYLL